MNARFFLLLAVVLCISLAVLADGCAYGKGFSPQLRETHQLAVIRLTETTADVNMFIAIDGIPAGKEITYILPFWYQPLNFSLTEEDSQSFRSECVNPAYNETMRMRGLSEHRGSNKILIATPFIGAGIPGLVYAVLTVPTFGEKGRYNGSVLPLKPYVVSETTQARAELYAIGANDLQQLIKQSGLPEKYLQPLKKYHTPYFAVMHLKGLAHTDKQPFMDNTHGVRYHFTHRLTTGEYRYPLGTGAAWPQPIPITEVYITCPEHLALSVKAPIEGKKIPWSAFYRQTITATEYLSYQPSERQSMNLTADDITKILTPKTSSYLASNNVHPAAWHIVYWQSNPAEDISVRITKRTAPWRFAIADFFQQPYVAAIIGIILYLLAWLLTAHFVIRRYWLLEDKPDPLFWFILITFINAQIYGPIMIASLLLCIIGYLCVISNMAYQVATVLFVVVAIVAGVLILIYYAWKRNFNWARWPVAIAWVVATSLYLVLTTALFYIVRWSEML